MGVRLLVSWVLLLGVFLSACGGTTVASDWPTVRDDILVPTCGFSSCHGAGESDFTVRADVLYDELVDVPSLQRPDMLRVVPGDPDASYLMWKLEGRAGIVGDFMPPSALLSEDKLESVRAWIEAGALDQ